MDGFVYWRERERQSKRCLRNGESVQNTIKSLIFSLLLLFMRYTKRIFNICFQCCGPCAVNIPFFLLSHAFLLCNASSPLSISTIQSEKETRRHHIHRNNTTFVNKFHYDNFGWRLFDRYLSHLNRLNGKKDPSDALLY